MALLIDGYNLMYAANIVGEGRGATSLERSRRRLLNRLAETIPPDDLPRTVVVFDAQDAPRDLPRQYDHQGMTVRFARREDGADELIEELIRADSAPRRLTVVSSDHRIQRAARRRRAEAVDSDVWLARLVSDRETRRQRRRKRASAKPKGPPPRSEVEYWLRQFTDGMEEDDLEGLDDRIFPPGYGEDLER